MNIDNLRLHIGIHETGKRDLQSILNNAQEHLGLHGHYILDESRYRTAFKSALKLGEMDDQIVIDAMKSKLSAFIPEGYHDVVLSEDNLIGPMLYNLTSRDFYPRAFNRLTLCQRAFESDNVEVFIGLQSYDSYYNRVYAWSAMYQEMNDFFFYKKRVLEQRERAQSLVKTVESVFGEVPITIWFSETSEGQEIDIATEIIGDELGSMDFDTDNLSLPSAKAVEVMRDAHFNEDPNLGLKMVANVMLDYPLGAYDPPQYWSEDEQKKLRGEYLADIEDIRQKENVQFLTDIPSF